MSDNGRKPPFLAGLVLAVGALIGGLLLRRRASQGENPNLPDRESLEAGHELKDMRPSQVARYLGCLVIAIVILVGVVTGLEALVLGHIGPIRAVIANPPHATPPPAPQLEISNGQVLDQIHARENQLLDNYSWIDQSKGTVRIPINRAIELTAQQGLPVRSQPAGQTQGGALTRPAPSSSGRTLEKIP